MWIHILNFIHLFLGCKFHSNLKIESKSVFSIPAMWLTGRVTDGQTDKQGVSGANRHTDRQVEQCRDYIISVGGGNNAKQNMQDVCIIWPVGSSRKGALQLSTRIQWFREHMNETSHVNSYFDSRGLEEDTSLIARLMWPTWGPSGADMTQVGPMLAPWTLLSGM